MALTSCGCGRPPTSGCCFARSPLAAHTQRSCGAEPEAKPWCGGPGSLGAESGLLPWLSGRDGSNAWEGGLWPLGRQMPPSARARSRDRVGRGGMRGRGRGSARQERGSGADGGLCWQSQVSWMLSRARTWRREPAAAGESGIKHLRLRSVHVTHSGVAPGPPSTASAAPPAAPAAPHTPALHTRPLRPPSDSFPGADPQGLRERLPASLCGLGPASPGPTPLPPQTSDPSRGQSPVPLPPLPLGRQPPRGWA